MAIAYYILDTETTGLISGTHEISECSIIRASDRFQLTRIVRALHPEKASYDALRITKKTAADLRKGIHPNQLINDIEMFLSEDGLAPQNRCLVAHNVAFDRKFLWTLWEKYNKQFPCHLFLDTLHMTKEYAKIMGLKTKYNLETSCDLLQLKKYGNSHNAQDDTRNCYLLWNELMKKIDYIKLIKNLPHNQTQYDDNFEF